MTETILQTNIPELQLRNRGKVRDIYDMGEQMLIVTTDRISAFDVVMPNGIPDKGKILTGLSNFWFAMMADIVPNHLVETDMNKLFAGRSFLPQLIDRTILVRKLKPLSVECIVRGYLSGSGWKEYQQSGTIGGAQMVEGLKESSKFPEPVFTPSTKAETGHDENISFEQAKDILGKTIADKVKTLSISIYTKARDYALTKGIIIADTKFEFGLDNNGEVILIDEILSPDSSRFWPEDKYQEGRGQASYDKQFVRDYLETLQDWNKTPPGPRLPEDIIAKSREKYIDAYERLTGKKYPG